MPVAYETVFRNMADCVIVIDDQNHITESNPSAQRILKLNPMETIGSSLEHILPKSACTSVLTPENLQFSKR